MLKLNLMTGTAFTKPIIVDGDLNSDLIQLIDDYCMDNKELPVATYSIEELEEYEIETFIPINGGEFYIEGISSVELF